MAGVGVRAWFRVSIKISLLMKISTFISIRFRILETLFKLSRVTHVTK